MVTFEMIVKALGLCSRNDGKLDDPCVECAYRNRKFCTAVLKKDARNMLIRLHNQIESHETIAEEESTPPTLEYEAWWCGHCGKEIVGDPKTGLRYENYCRRCGRKVRWDV